MFQCCQGDYYTDSGNNAVPIRWLAPEVVEPSNGSVILRHITKDCNLWFVFLHYVTLGWTVVLDLYLNNFVCDFITVFTLPIIGGQSIVISMLVFLVCVWLSACISQKPNILISSNLMYMLPVAVAPSFSDDSAIRYVLLVSYNGPKLSTTLHLVELVRRQHRGQSWMSTIASSSSQNNFL